MAWKLSDEVVPDSLFGNVQAGSETSAAPQRFALSSEQYLGDDPGIPDPGGEMADILRAGVAGARHRFVDVANARQAFDAEHPVAGAMRNALPFGLGAVIPDSALHAFGANPAGPAEIAANRQTVANDANDHVSGFLPSVAYGITSNPETLAVPELRIAGKLPGVLNYAGKALNAGITGAAIGGYDAVTNDRNATQGSLYGAAGGLGGKALGSAISKTFNAVRGRWADPALRAMDQAAAAKGVNLSVGDLAPDSGFRKMEDWGMFIPGSGAPAAMKTEAQTYAQLLDDLKTNSAAPIAAKLAANATPEQLIVASAKRELGTRSAEMKRLFGLVPQDVTVEPTNFLPALKTLLTQDKSIVANRAVSDEVRDRVGLLLDPERALSDTERGALATMRANPNLPPAAQQQYLAAVGVDPAVIAQKLRDAQTLKPDEAHWMQSELGSLARAFKEQTDRGDLPGGAAKFTSLARDALNNDIDAVTSGEHAIARNYARTQVMPFRDDDFLRSLVEPGATGDRLLGKLGANDVGRAKLLMGSLDPEGQAALRYAFLSQAVNKAVNDNLTSGLSTAAARKALNVGNELGQQRQLAEIFTPQQQGQIAGLRDIGMSANRLQTWAHNPHTGAQNLPINLIRGALTMLGTGAGAHEGGGMGALIGGMIGTAAPVVSSSIVTALARSPTFKRAYFAKGESALDPVLQAMLANEQASQAQPSILDYLGQ